MSEADDSDGQSFMSTASDNDLDISLADQLVTQKKRQSGYTNAPLSPIHNRLALDNADLACGLCGTEHPNRPCFMTESSENLAEYRRLLTTLDSDEPIEERVGEFSFIVAITETDRTLTARRGGNHRRNVT
jgi:chromodomain-helicase-DNA-binding protein 4